jgi:hypothetical protein
MTTPDTYRVFRVFISSPGDVQNERQIVKNTIGMINKTIRDTLAAVIDVRCWEDYASGIKEPTEDEFQDWLNREVEQCHFFILILYKRYGTIDPGYRISRTEREIETILKARQKKRKPLILSYFRELDLNSDPGDQESQVIELRSRLKKLRLPYQTYRNEEEFREYLTHNLYDVLLRNLLSGFKKRALSRFWKFGVSGEANQLRQPSIAILYPPVERLILAEGGDRNYWLKKLASQVALEDYKAIQIIEKDLRLLGIHDCRVHPHTDPPSGLANMNRIWLCLPRNRAGLRALSNHHGVRFKFPTSNGRPQSINWRSEKGHWIEVVSPMSEYLRRQRSDMDISGEWHGQLGQIIAKDFAVVSRLQRALTTEEAEPLWDYFFGGIRGLGTWGSAFFVDRQYKRFLQCDEDKNIELLLEVTYQDAGIVEVVDVSEYPADYFYSENDPVTIERNICQYRG